MAFLGGLFDAFTGDPGKEAAARNAALFQQYGTQGTNILGQYGTQAGQLYQNYLGQAQPLIQRTGDIFGQYGTTGQQYLGTAEEQARRALAGGVTGAEQQFGGAREAIQQGIGAYAPLTALGQRYGGATDLYLGALGVGGPAGIARAQGAFQAGPGYQFQQDETRRALEASAAARGGLLGGNTATALQDRASQLANQEYGNYLNRLQGFVAPELQATAGAAGGIAGQYGNLANIYGQQAGLYPATAAREAQLLADIGRLRTGVAGEVAGGQAGALTKEAGLLGDVTGARAGVLGQVAGGQVNIAGNVAGGQAAANTQAAQAAMNASQNFWNGLLNLGGAAIKGFSGPSAPSSASGGGGFYGLGGTPISTESGAGYSTPIGPTRPWYSGYGF